MVGYCVKASNGAAGVLMVHPQNGYELSELHDVYVNSPTSGQILIYDATSGQTRWENASLGAGDGITVTPGPGSLSVALDPEYAPTFLGLALSGLSASQFVKTDAAKNLVSQQYIALGSEVTGTLGPTYGGTNQSTWATGDMLYASAANTLNKRTIGSTGDVLTVSGGVPTWAPPATSGTVTSVSTVTTGMGLTMAVANASTTPQITLAGTLNASKGGTGTDLSASTGILAVLSGSVSAREIGNGDIASAAAIVRSKLATGSAYRVLANGSDGAMTEVASTGSAGQVLVSGGASALPTWANATTGTVTSITLSTGTTGLLVNTNQTAQTITSSGTITLTGTLGVANGGTGATSLTGYVKGTGSAALTASASIPVADVTGAAPLASPTFSGIPAADTAAAGTNTTQLATTAFVTTAVQNAKNAPYDLSGDAYGVLSSEQTVFRFIAPRNITLSSIATGGGAALKVQIADADVTLPQNVTSGQKISVLTTSAGTDAWFTITGKVT
jgi:hypothetical protein